VPWERIVDKLGCAHLFGELRDSPATFQFIAVYYDISFLGNYLGVFVRRKIDARQAPD